METAYRVIVIFAIIVAVVFSALIIITGKGDAMSGGGGAVRTTFKGRATFDDRISQVTLGLGALFMISMLVLDFMGHRMHR